MPSKQFLLRERERFRLTDPGLARALTADLARLGHVDISPGVSEPAEFETAVPDELEHAVPRKGGRPKLPRCEHDQIVGRCLECQEEE